jgi:hypothetical protein
MLSYKIQQLTSHAIGFERGNGNASIKPPGTERPGKQKAENR